MRIRELEEGGLGACDGVDIEAMSAKRVLVGLGGRILFYPTLLYNVLRNQIEAEFRWWDEVDQYLLLGAVPFPKDVHHFQQLGVKGVVTLNEPYETLVPSSLYKAHGIDHLVIPTRDYLFAPSLVDISRAVDFIHRNASGGRITYVHCKAGRGRSTTIVLCYLIKYKNMTPADALEYVRSRRPRVLLAKLQWQAVQDYCKRISEFPTLQDCVHDSLPAGDSILTEGDNEGCFRDWMLLLHQPEKVTPAGISPAASPLLEDEVLITEEDLEGYQSISQKDQEEYEIIINEVSDDQISTCYGKVGARRMASKLSCLFSSFKFSGSTASASNSLQAVRAW